MNAWREAVRLVRALEPAQCRDESRRAVTPVENPMPMPPLPVRYVMAPVRAPTMGVKTRERILS